MIKLTDVFPTLTAEQLADPIQLGQFFIDEIVKFPGHKVGFIGQPQSGTTLSVHYINTKSFDKKVICLYDPRGIPDTFNGTLPYFEDLNAVIEADIPDWMALIKQAPKNNNVGTSEGEFIFDDSISSEDSAIVIAMVSKISEDVVGSRRMLLWKSVLNLFCLRDLLLANGNIDADAVVILDLPYFPAEYNQHFEKLVLLKRRPNWFTDPLFLAHISVEGINEQSEKDLIAVRDQELADYQSVGQWVFDYEILNDDSVQSLESKLDTLVNDLTK
jgi:hypothetical protein